MAQKTSTPADEGHAGAVVDGAEGAEGAEGADGSLTLVATDLEDDAPHGFDASTPSTPTASGFPIVRRGYDRDAVDSSFERATARIEELERTVADQRERLVQAMKRPMLHELDEAELLVIASEETSQLVRAAQARASAVRETAETEAATIRDVAHSEHDELVTAGKRALEDARARAATTLDEAEARATTLVDEAQTRAATLVEEAEARAAQVTDDAQRRANFIASDADQLSTQQLADTQARVSAIVEEAQGTARGIVDDANRRATSIIDSAEERYDQIRATIKVHRKRLREELDSQRDELQQIVDSLTALRREFGSSFQQATETLDQVRSVSGMLWRFGEPVQRAEGYVERVFDQLGDASLPPRREASDSTEATGGAEASVESDESDATT